MSSSVCLVHSSWNFQQVISSGEHASPQPDSDRCGLTIFFPEDGTRNLRCLALTRKLHDSLQIFRIQDASSPRRWLSIYTPHSLSLSPSLWFRIVPLPSPSNSLSLYLIYLDKRGWLLCIPLRYGCGDEPHEREEPETCEPLAFNFRN